MFTLLRSLVWGLIVFQSFAATGRIVARLLGSPHRREVGLPACWGLATMTLLGGIFNLAGIARPPALIVLVLATIIVDALWDWRAAIGIGAAAPTPDGDTSAAPPTRWAGLWIIPLVGLVGLKYLASLAVAFNAPDDQPAYLLHVARMLETGSIGIDPFGGRQLMSLNGATFLVALLCSVAPLAHVFLLDPGICWIILAAMTWSMVRRDMGGSPAEACLLTAMVLMADIPFINVTGYLASSVLFLGLIRVACLASDPTAGRPVASSVLMAITIAALFALKSTCIFFVGLFLMIWYGLRLLRSFDAATVREICLIGVVSSTLMIPWMWQQYRSGGTPLYPFLGKGYYVSGPGLSPYGDSLTAKTKSLIYALSHAPIVSAMFATALLIVRPFPDAAGRWRVLTAALLGSVFGLAFLAFYTVTNALERYSYGFLYAGLIAAGLQGYFSPRERRERLGFALCLAIFVGAQWTNLHTKMAMVVDVARRGRHVTLHEDGEDRRLREAQATVAAGKTILVCLQDPFLLDFARNPILHLDQAGTVGPPPGFPVTDDAAGLRDFLRQRTKRLPAPVSSERLLRYLRDVGIEYLMFQRGDETTWYTTIAIPPKPYWVRIIQTLATLALDEMKGLIPLCKTLYDDGDLVVLDLTAPPVPSKPAGSG